MKRVLGGLVFLPAAALAQEGAPAPAGPVPIKPQLCLKDYPIDALKKGQMGSTTVLLHVDAEGKPKNIIIAGTSGSEELDAAAAYCAKDWRFEPAKHDGQAVDAPFTQTVEWLIASPIWRVSLALRDPLPLCPAATEAAGKRFGWNKPVTTIAYTLKDGEVVNTAVQHSSGDPELDQTAAACVSTWHFKPQTEDPNITVTATLISGPNAARDTSKSLERTPQSMIARPTTGPGLATFDWRNFGAD